MADDGLKQCTKCKRWLPRAEFYKHKAFKDGLRTLCKQCHHEGAKDWLARHPGKSAAYSEKWREANPEKRKAYEEAHKEELRVYRHGYYLQHRERVLERCHEYYERNKAKKLVYSRSYWRKHGEECRELRRAYREAHKEEIRKQGHEYYQATKERHAVRGREWRKKYPERIREILRRAGHARRAIEGSYTKQEWLDLCAKYGNRCLCCGRQVELTVDHVVPVTKGGTSYIWNIQPLCKSCNSKKRDKTIDYRPAWEKDTLF